MKYFHHCGKFHCVITTQAENWISSLYTCYSSEVFGIILTHPSANYILLYFCLLQTKRAHVAWVYLEKFSLILQRSDSYVTMHSTQNSRTQKMLVPRASLALLRLIKIYQLSYKSKPEGLTMGWETIQYFNLYHLETSYAEDLPQSLLRNPPKRETLPIT